MNPYYQDDLVTLWHGDCVKVMRELPEASVHAVVTDPPYELAFMGKGWDASGIAYNPEVWANALRALKPGGHLLAFGGTRTWHRLAVAIEDAGFEVRDNIAYLHDGGLPGPLAWVYGSGFPKSLDVSKAIDKAAGVEREVVGTSKGVGVSAEDNRHGGINRGAVGIKQSAIDVPITAPATPAAQQWQGWGTALKPAFEPIVVARKPLIGTVAENVLAHGTGALNIDGCRIPSDEPIPNHHGTNGAAGVTYGTRKEYVKGSAGPQATQTAGRWPANVILDESQAAELDRQSGVIKGQVGMTKTTGGHRFITGDTETVQHFDHGVTDTGGASRFFYVPKANASERPRDGDTAHPTVKPLDLMRYLVKLVTPPGGTVLEPFAGSGTTLEACVVEGFHVIGIELTEDYLPLIVQRLSKPIEQVMW